MVATRASTVVGLLVLALALPCLCAGGSARSGLRNDVAGIHHAHGSENSKDDSDVDVDLGRQGEDDDDDNDDAEGGREGDDDEGEEGDADVGREGDDDERDADRRREGDDDEGWDRDGDGEEEDEGGADGPSLKLFEDSYGRIDGARAVTRVRRLTGPDFTKGDASWRQRLSELVSRRPGIFSRRHAGSNGDRVALAAAAPLTALYVLAQHHARLFPKGAVPNPFRVHVAGAAYTFEGRGDWRLLGDAMPPGVSLEVTLVVGRREEGDGVQEMDGIDLFKEKVCREHGNTKVVCVESYYQDVMERLDKPHMALLFNPGFPQVHRRTWDKPLLFLLKEQIPTAVSAQVTDRKGWPSVDKPWDCSFFSYGNEDFAINETLAAYGADVWSTTGSPFFIVANRPSGEKWIKNGVIEVFRGLSPGAAQPQPPALLPREELTFLKEFDWKAAERTTDDTTLHDELRGALETPVSDAFVRAADAVYLRLLQDTIDFRGRTIRGERFRLRGNRRKVFEQAKALMTRMRNMERLEARDWIFLKTAFDMD